MIKFIFRSLKKNKLITSLKFFSLVIGIGISYYILEINSYEKSYDRFWKDSDRMYRVALNHERNGELVTKSARNFDGAPYLLKAEIPGIESACTILKDAITVFYNNNQFNNVQWIWTDPSFFQVFDRKILKTESSDLFSDLHGVLISRSFAEKLFGTDNPLHKKFKLNEGWEFFVTAVFEDIPANSHLAVDVVGTYASVYYYMNNFNNATGKLIDNPNYRYSEPNPYQESAWKTEVRYRPHCYIKLAPSGNIETINSQSQAALKNIRLPDDLAGSKLDLLLQPIQDIHLFSDLQHEYRPNGSHTKVRFLYLIALVVLLVCAINFLNLTTIETIDEGKQLAIRILNGARMHSIIGMLLFRNLLVSFFAGTIGVLSASQFIRFFRPECSFQIENGLIITLILLLIAVMSSLIPFYTTIRSRFQDYLKTQSGTLSGTWNGRRILVVFQFSVTIILISITLMINKQLDFMNKYELGFNPKQTIFSLSPLSMNMRVDKVEKIKTFRNEMMQIPGVQNIAFSSSIPGISINRHSENIKRMDSAEPIASAFKIISVNEGYLPCFGINLVAGRNFLEQANSQSNETIITETAAKELGYKNPESALDEFLDFQGQPLKIAGVINDYHHLSLKEKIAPTILVQNLDWDYSVGYYSIQFDALRTKEILSEISSVWNKTYPGEVASFGFTNEQYASQYQDEYTFNRILSLGSFVALLISCIGLFVLSSFDTRKRIKEIGIRKINGARVSEVIRLLNKDLVKWVAIAFVIATPIAYYAMHKWLENFAYKTELSWWIFALAGLLALGIALLTVSWQSWRAATRNPVEALRYE